MVREKREKRVRQKERKSKKDIRSIIKAHNRRLSVLLYLNDVLDSNRTTHSHLQL